MILIKILSVIANAIFIMFCISLITVLCLIAYGYIDDWINRDYLD